MTQSATALSELSSHYNNFLSADETYFISSPGTWTATNASVVVDNTILFKNRYRTLNVQAISAGSPYTEVELTHQPFLVGPEYVTDSIDATAFFYSSLPVEIRVEISNSLSQSVSTEYVFVPASTWTLIRSEFLAVPTNVVNQTFSASFTIRSSNGQFNLLMAHPVVKNAYGFADNFFLRETISGLPRFLVDLDSEQTRPQFPMSRFMDVGLIYADRAFRQTLDFRYRDISEGYLESDDSTKSTLIDPEIVDPEYLPWLAQFVGTRRFAFIQTGRVAAVISILRQGGLTSLGNPLSFAGTRASGLF